ncbi:MAG: ABC transporter ATP-binding protein [Candidatus Thiodiazotropha endolucinida]
MIELQAVYKSYHREKVVIPVLQGVSFRIEPNEFVALMGPSGSGKSTLLNIIGCLDHFDSGTYMFAGTDISNLDDNHLTRLRNENLGFVFQLFNLIPRISARRNVELPMLYRGIPLKKRHSLAQEALERMGLSKWADHSPAELSGGQQQRVAIARALVNSPQLIIADEPTGSLDTKTGNEIMALFQELHHAGTTILLVTHEQEVAKYAQRTIHLKDGQVVGG